MTTPEPDRRERPRLAAAAGWVVLFTLAFFAVVPTGADVSRGAFWSAVPFQLLDVVDPPDESEFPPAGLAYLPQRFDLLALAALVLLGSRSLGSWMLRLPVMPRFESRLEREVFAWGLGMSGWSLVVLGLGLLGCLSAWLFGGLLGLVLVADVAVAIRRREFVSGTSKTHEEPIPRWVWFVAAPFLVLFVLGAVLPPTEYDAKGYHLLGPKEFFLAGRVGYLPHNVYTSFPFLTEMLTLTGMVVRGDWFRGALIGRLVLAAFGPLTALVLFVTARRGFGTRAGWLAAIVYLTLPWTYVLSTTSYVEGAFSFFLALTLLAVLRTIDSMSSDERSPNWALLAGLMAGSAMACKYPALPLVVVPASLAIAVAAFRRVRTTTGEGAPDVLPASQTSAFLVVTMYLAGVAITVGPWLLKNTFETGNPVYPLAYDLFGGGDLTPELAVRWSEAHSPDDHDPTGIPRHLLELTVRNTWLSPLLYGFAPLALLVLLRGTGDRAGNDDRARRATVVGAWLTIVWIFIAWWAFTHRIDRFWAPMLPVVALLAGIGASRFDQPAWRTGVAVLVGLSATFSLALVTTQVTSGQAGFNSYLVDLDEARPATERITAPAVFAANGSLMDDAVVLCVGEAQVFDARFRSVYHSVFNQSQFEQWLADADRDVAKRNWELRPSTEVREALAEHGMTHVLVNWAEIARYTAPGSYGFSEFVRPERFTELEDLGVLREVETGPSDSWRLYAVVP